MNCIKVITAVKLSETIKIIAVWWWCRISWM